ncbi:hypothetical protein [Kitasatospora cinereorecta]|uniref:Dienelactone hydrolase family protein n=1 Tax=Kitasatospora cinereorecta TaxID=285560 RepID=A0ABW0VML8_9ACTN
MHVIAASFSGGAAALHAAHRPGNVDRLVLLNPRLDYKERYGTSRPGWSNDYLSGDTAVRLDERGFTEKSPFELNRALLNEVFCLDTPAILAGVRAPVLMVHGTTDTFVPVESSRRHRSMFGGPVELVELDGAQHGFAVHDDPRYLDPQSQVWQREVIERVGASLADSAAISAVRRSRNSRTAGRSACRSFRAVSVRCSSARACPKGGLAGQDRDAHIREYNQPPAPTRLRCARTNSRLHPRPQPPRQTWSEQGDPGPAHGRPGQSSGSRTNTGRRNPPSGRAGHG